MAFNIVEECRIYPPSASVSLTSIPLTIFDLHLLTSPPVQKLFFYQFDCSNPLFTQTILPKLKTSLSLTLQYFLPLAGNLTWPRHSTKPEIIYKDGDSVSFIVCSSDHDFSHLSGNQEVDVNLLFSLVSQLPNASDHKQYPVLALQVTLFPNNGICIGLTYHHAVGDGKTLTQFIKSWAAVSFSGDTSFIANSPPFYDRSMFNHMTAEMDANFLEKLKKENNITKEEFNLPQHHVIPTGNLLATFVLHSSDIKKLEQWVLTCLNNESKNSSPPPHLSAFMLTCAYVWICWIKAQQCGEKVEFEFDSTEEEDCVECLYVPIDCRWRLVPPLPPTYFGNCTQLGKAEGKRSDLVGKDGIAIAAELIGEAVKNKDGHSPFTSRRILAVAGSPRFGSYEIDFGWGKPNKAEYASIATAPVVSLTDCPGEAGAVEVGVAFNKIEMEAFTSLFVNTIEGI